MRKHFLVAVGVVAVLVGGLAAAGLVSASSTPVDSQKQALFQHLAATETANAQQPHATKNPSGASGHSSCPQQFQPGVYPFRFGPNDMMRTYHIVNTALAVTTSGDAYSILAGSLISNPRQGVMVVRREVTDPCATSTHYQPIPYLMPEQQGAITLNQVTGDTVSFVTETGITGRFAYATGQFQA